MPLLDERADRGVLQGADPADAIEFAHLLDALLADHAAVADHHELLDTEALAQALDLGRQRQTVADVALVHRHRDRAAAHIGEQAVVDLERAFAPVAAVADPGQRTGGAFEVTRRQVVQHQRAGAQVTGGELFLDRVLARQQPVHRRIQIVLIGVGHAELLGQRGAVPPARGGQLGVRRHDARGHHGQNPIAFGAGLGADHRGKAQVLHGHRHRLHSTVGS